MSEEHTITEEVASFIVESDFSRLPAPVVAIAKEHILDGLAVILAGAATSPASIVQEHVRLTAAEGPCRVLACDLTRSAPAAALANGVAGHALDFDDTQLSASPDRVYGLLTHPTVPVLAAALAVGQEVRASGRDLLSAVCAGIEVECRIADAIDPRHYQQGFHSTGTVGVFGAVAAACRLLGLPFGKTRHALGIAASKGAGIRANFGTMTKPYHAGAAAEGGVVATRLATLGFEADASALDGPWGFFQVAGGGCDPERISGRLGNPYYLLEPGVSIKPYPCGTLIHPAMDDLLDLVRREEIARDDVEEMRLGTSSNVLAALRYREPRTALEAKFSIPFCLSIIVLERAAGIAQFQDEVVLRPELRRLMTRVQPYLHPEIEAKGYDRIRSELDLRLRNGRTYTLHSELARGTPQRPLTLAELEAKFRDCARLSLPDGKADQVIARVFALEGEGDINSLVQLMAC